MRILYSFKEFDNQRGKGMGLVGLKIRLNGRKLFLLGETCNI